MIQSVMRCLMVLVVGMLVAGCAGKTSSSGPWVPLPNSVHACDRELPEESDAETGLRGNLLLIGGGLDDDNKPVYERFVELARRQAGDEPPRVVIATAASGDQPANVTGKTESIRAYCAECVIEAILRETPEAETVAVVDAADAMFFTGGDQKRITERYLDEAGRDKPEAAAMRRLLMRGGVIAGTSAGEAMMSDPMFFGGRSVEALGIRLPSAKAEGGEDEDGRREPPPLGPRIGKGMGMLPWAIVDSHFFERHRFGRLVAALEASGVRLGVGVGEDACVEVDLATGEMSGVSVAESLLVDAGAVTREGLTRRGVRTRVIGRGMRVSLVEWLKRPVGDAAASRTTRVSEMPVVEPGQNRQLASWRFFSRAQQGDEAIVLRLEGYEQTAWPDGRGGAVVEIGPRAER